MTAPLKLIENDPTIQNLLSRMPEEVAQSFSEKQLTHLMVAIGARAWGKHSIDIRGTAKFPLYRWRFYFVFLLGKNHRNLSHREQEFSRVSIAIAATTALVCCTLLGLLTLYLIKSALGIDLIPGFSFGIWSWFKETVL